MSINAILNISKSKFTEHYLLNYNKKIRDLITEEFQEQVTEKIAIMILEENNIKKEDIIEILNETEDEIVRLRGLKTYFKEEINIDIEDIEDLNEFRLNFLINSKQTIEIDRKREELSKVRESKFIEPLFQYQVYANTIETNNEIFLGKKYGKMTKKEQYKNLVAAFKMSSGISKILIEDEMKNFVLEKKEYKLHNEKTMFKLIVLLDTLLKHNKENKYAMNDYFKDVIRNTYDYYQFFKEDAKIHSYVKTIITNVDKTYNTQLKSEFIGVEKKLS